MWPASPRTATYTASRIALCQFSSLAVVVIGHNATVGSVVSARVQFFAHRPRGLWLLFAFIKNLLQTEDPIDETLRRRQIPHLSTAGYRNIPPILLSAFQSQPFLLLLGPGSEACVRSASTSSITRMITFPHRVLQTYVGATASHSRADLATSAGQGLPQGFLLYQPSTKPCRPNVSNFDVLGNRKC